MANETAKRKIPDGAYATAMELLEAGQPAAAVEQRLLSLGVSVDDAKQIIQDHQRATAQATAEEGRKDMKGGPIAAVLGVLVLIVSGPGSITGWFGLAVGLFWFFYGWYRQRQPRRTD